MKNQTITSINLKSGWDEVELEKFCVHNLALIVYYRESLLLKKRYSACLDMASYNSVHREMRQYEELM